MANLLEMFPDNPFTTGAEFVANGLVWIARHASGDLPGLHSMDGDGDLIARAAGAAGSAGGCAIRRWSPTTARQATVLQRLLDTGVDQFFGIRQRSGRAVGRRLARRSARRRRSFPRRASAASVRAATSGAPIRHARQFLRAAGDRGLSRRALAGQAQQALTPLDPAERSCPTVGCCATGRAGVAAAAAAARRRTGGRSQRRPTAGRAAAEPARRSARRRCAITVVNGDLTFESARCCSATTARRG